MKLRPAPPRSLQSRILRWGLDWYGGDTTATLVRRRLWGQLYLSRVVQPWVLEMNSSKLDVRWLAQRTAAQYDVLPIRGEPQNHSVESENRSIEGSIGHEHVQDTDEVDLYDPGIEQNKCGRY